jgi:hypothetical protein
VRGIGNGRPAGQREAAALVGAIAVKLGVDLRVAGPSGRGQPW